MARRAHAKSEHFAQLQVALLKLELQVAALEDSAARQLKHHLLELH